MSNFRALIVGAGPNGLLSALKLQRPGVDFIILEKREVADLNLGSSVRLWPRSVRILDQLGLLKDAEESYMPSRGSVT
jgi:2-polyprenyl-6-methoxyphenol hydroxylase-like FAD-dependent oxidoreductase